MASAAEERRRALARKAAAAKKKAAEKKRKQDADTRRRSASIPRQVSELTAKAEAEENQASIAYASNDIGRGDELMRSAKKYRDAIASLSKAAPAKKASRGVLAGDLRDRSSAQPAGAPAETFHRAERPGGASVGLPAGLRMATSPNASRNEIIVLQTHLKNQGLYGGRIDGIWGPKTQAGYDALHGRAASTAGSGGGVGAGGGAATAAHGSSADPGGAPASGPGLTQDELKAEISRSYGYLAAYFDHAEIGPKLREAAEKGWDEARLMGALFATNWWQQTSSIARQWDALKATDPAEAARRVDQSARLVGAMANRMGLALTPTRSGEIASIYNRLGWDEADLQSALGNEFSYSAGQPYGGDMGAAIAKAKELAAQYMIPMDEQTAFNHAKKMMRGEADEDNIIGYLRLQAVSRFPHLKNYIDAGITPQDFFSPYRMEIGRMLGRSADTIDMMNDPKFSAIVDTVDEKGQRRPMTLSETQMYVRRLDDWRTTSEANARGAEVGQFLLEKFGAV